MKKVPTLFERDWNGDRSRVVPELNPAASWVADGEGVPTRKWDGTPVLVRDGKMFKRYDVKAGKVPPAGFEPSQEPDEITGHWPGWVPISADDPQDKWFFEGWKNTVEQLTEGEEPTNGTYELVGPKINGNRDQLVGHVLMRHGNEILSLPSPLTFDNIREFLTGADIEGIVWHRNLGDPDTDMVKIKDRDFGLKRGRGRMY